jgi:hypothetical protein
MQDALRREAEAKARLMKFRAAMAKRLQRSGKPGELAAFVTWFDAGLTAARKVDEDPGLTLPSDLH